MRVTKFFIIRIGYRKMREINRIAEQTKRNEAEFIQIGTPFEENKLET